MTPEAQMQEDQKAIEAMTFEMPPFKQAMAIAMMGLEPWEQDIVEEQMEMMREMEW